MKIKEFCKYCDDGPNGLDDCDRHKQGRYAFREWCGWSHIDGVKVETTADYIGFNNQEIPRDDLDAIKAAVQIEVEKGNNYCKKPEISVLERVVEQRG